MELKDLVQVADELKMDKWMVRDREAELRSKFGYSADMYISKEELYLFVKIGEYGLNSIFSRAFEYACKDMDALGDLPASDRFKLSNIKYREGLCDLAIRNIRNNPDKSFSIDSITVDELRRRVKVIIDKERKQELSRGE